MPHFLDDVVLYLIQQNVLMQYSNNRYVFICNNRNTLFQYRPTLLEKSCQQTWPSTVKYLVSWIVYEYNFYEQAKNGFSVLVTIRSVF